MGGDASGLDRPHGVTGPGRVDPDERQAHVGAERYHVRVAPEAGDSPVPVPVGGVALHVAAPAGPDRFGDPVRNRGGTHRTRAQRSARPHTPVSAARIVVSSVQSREPVTSTRRSTPR